MVLNFDSVYTQLKEVNNHFGSRGSIYDHFSQFTDQNKIKTINSTKLVIKRFLKRLVRYLSFGRLYGSVSSRTFHLELYAIPLNDLSPEDISDLSLTQRIQLRKQLESACKIFKQLKANNEKNIKFFEKLFNALDKEERLDLWKEGIGRDFSLENDMNKLSIKEINFYINRSLKESDFNRNILVDSLKNALKTRVTDMLQNPEVYDSESLYILLHLVTTNGLDEIFPKEYVDQLKANVDQLLLNIANGIKIESCDYFNRRTSYDVYKSPSEIQEHLVTDSIVEVEGIKVHKQFKKDVGRGNAYTFTRSDGAVKIHNSAKKPRLLSETDFVLKRAKEVNGQLGKKNKEWFIPVQSFLTQSSINGQLAKKYKFLQGKCINLKSQYTSKDFLYTSNAIHIDVQVEKEQNGKVKSVIFKPKLICNWINQSNSEKMKIKGADPFEISTTYILEKNNKGEFVVLCKEFYND